MHIKKSLVTIYRAINTSHLTSFAASISFFTIFSVPSFVIIVIFMADLMIDDQIVHQYAFEFLSKYINPNIAIDIQSSVEKAKPLKAGIISSIVGFALLMWSSNSIFVHFKRGLQQIFESTMVEVLSLKQKIWHSISSFALIGTLGLLFLIFILMDVGINILQKRSMITISHYLWLPYAFKTISVACHAFVFALFYRMLGRTTLSTRRLLIGGLIASIFFTFGKSFLLNFIISSRWSNVYGAAGNFVIFLLWMYYNSFIVLLGAQIAQIFHDLEFLYKKHETL